jgi:pimeloyl-ACP methyl ester carboxylesterase
MITTAAAAPDADSDHRGSGEGRGSPASRKIRRWARVLGWILAGILTLSLTGTVYQEVATRRDQQMLPPAGELIDIGTHRLHLNCTGYGSPAVILEAGNLGMSADWIKIQQRVAEVTRVCSYDRAGTGWSDTGPAPRDADQISVELRTLLTHASVAPPYVLVGHSYGGLYALRYTGQYPDDVDGLVLLDSSHPEQFTRSAEGRAMFRRTNRLGAVLPLLTQLGIVRLTNFLPAHPDLPPQQRTQVRAFHSTTRHVTSSVAEFRCTAATTTQAGSTRSVDDKPLAVVTAGEQTGDWLQMQDELAALSSNSIHRIVAGASHASLLFTDRDAAVSNTTIDEVIQSVRAHRPLRR